MDLLDTLFSIIAAASGATAVILLMAAFLGKLLIKGVAEAVAQGYARSLAEHQAQVDRETHEQDALRATQVTRYFELWEVLCELKEAADAMVESISPRRAHNLGSALRSTEAAIRRSSVVLEEEHEKRLESLLAEFRALQAQLDPLDPATVEEASVADIGDDLIRSADSYNELWDEMRAAMRTHLAPMRRPLTSLPQRR